MNYAQLLHDKLTLRILALEERVRLNVDKRRHGPGTPASISKNHDAPYEKVSEDLEAIKIIIESKKPLVVLEFGSGWSTLAISEALSNLRHSHKSFPFSVERHTDFPFTCVSLDESEHWLEVSKERMPETLRQNVEFFYSPVVQRVVNETFTLSYSSIPMVKPDFIYLDGPSQFAVNENANLGSIFGTNKPWFPPIASDVLTLEWILDPGAVILIDGRGQNVEFLVRHLERDWAVSRFKDLDLSLLTLVSPPIGDHNRNKLIWELGE